MKFVKFGIFAFALSLFAVSCAEGGAEEAKEETTEAVEGAMEATEEAAGDAMEATEEAAEGAMEAAEEAVEGEAHDHAEGDHDHEAAH